jgi:hypothetical protein
MIAFTAVRDGSVTGIDLRVRTPVNTWTQQRTGVNCNQNAHPQPAPTHSQ